MTVLITGASGGLGRSMALEAARLGHHLVLTDLSAAGLEAIRQGILRQYAVQVECYPCDVMDPASVASLFQALENEHVSVDMLLNIAGVDYEGGFLDIPCEQVIDIVRVNIEGSMRMIHGALSHRTPGGHFNLVVVSSLASLYPIPLKATYAASKRFLLDFCTALAQEVSGQDVSVLTLCPGGLPTTQGALQGIEAQGFWGRATTNSLPKVARRTIARALRGKRLYIPGLLNRTFSVCSALVPRQSIARLLYARWSQARAGRPAGERLVG